MTPGITDVLKIGGNQLDDPAFVAGMAVAVRVMVAAGTPPVIVHGGGRAIRALQERFGIQPRTIGGLRVTDEQTMALVMMALIGSANVSLVAALTGAGVEAQGFSGADRGLLRSRQLTHPGGDLGRVGRIVSVRAGVIRAALAEGVVPVIAPVALAEDGGFHNVNADQAAGAVAAALGAGRVIFLTDVPGVLRDGSRLERMARAEAEALISGGIARDGMAVKIGAALDALAAGVARAVITDLAGLSAGEGTVVSG
jgi:acetylglutamate kinase